MNIVKPRITDIFDVAVSQEKSDFAIPLIHEDLPLYVDPFLLWKSPSQQDYSLHTGIIASLNNIGWIASRNREEEALQLIMQLSECSEVGLGTSRNKKGRRISKIVAQNILNIFSLIPDITRNGISHLEEIQLLVDGISKDRISDFSCNLLKSFLIDFTIQQCDKYGIQHSVISNIPVYQPKSQKFLSESVGLPINPETGDPLLFVPKRWLRYIPWIDFDDYFSSHFIKNIDQQIISGKMPRIDVLNYNRQNYDMVLSYVKEKERTNTDCRNDPLFMQIPVLRAKNLLSKITKLPTGKSNSADKEYERYASNLMASLMYPQLDFAETQCRTDSGSQIRDLVFYNTRDYPFLKDLFESYNARQIVMELKNVNQLERDHINQLNRYMSDSFGKFGIILTRNPPPKSLQKNLIDLWAGNRKCILVLTDQDLEMMVDVFESKQRLPIDVLSKKYTEFIRTCPS